jgi:hypothetical protein
MTPPPDPWRNRPRRSPVEPPAGLCTTRTVRGVQSPRLLTTFKSFYRPALAGLVLSFRFRGTRLKRANPWRPSPRAPCALRLESLVRCQRSALTLYLPAPLPPARFERVPPGGTVEQGQR